MRLNRGKLRLKRGWGICSPDQTQTKPTFTDPRNYPLEILVAPLTILSLLHPLDRYRAPSAIGSAIGRALSRPIPHPNTVVGVFNRLVLNRLGRGGGGQPRDSGATVSETSLRQARNKNLDPEDLSHRPPVFLGVDAVWGGSVLSWFLVGFWSLLVIFDRN